MKTRKNLMVLVLLSLFLSVGVADSDVAEAESPWGDISEVTEALAEAKEASEREKRAIEANKASIEAEKKAGTMEEALAERNAAIAAILRK